MFIHLPIEQQPDIATINKNGKRFYKVDKDKLYPSITSILGAVEKPTLNDWRNSLGPVKADAETKRAADRGTAVHAMLEKMLQNHDNPTENYNIDHIVEFNSLKLFIRNINNILLQEGALYSDVLKVAGRVDCIADYKGKLSIIDFKTSTRDKPHSLIYDYFLQTTAYAIMFSERYNIHVENIVIIMSVEKGAVPLIFTGKVDDYILPLIERINTYYENQKD